MLLRAALKQGTSWHLLGSIIYGATLVTMFTTSMIMHSLPDGERKKRFTMYDHMSIYAFIAGSYTPFLLVAMRGETRWQIFGLIWGTAVAGIIYKRFYTGRYMWISTVGYLVMGWFVATLWDDLYAVLDAAGLYLLLGGGVCYTAGIVFFVWERLPYHHAIWHVFVLAGAALHFGCVYKLILHS